MTRFTATVLLCFYLGSVALISAAGARAHFLPHKSRLTARQKVAYFERSVRHERQATAWLSRRLYLVGATREYRWHRAALRWHLSLLAQWQAKLVRLALPAHYAGWVCIHSGEGWSRSGTYSGPLQMTTPWMGNSLDWGGMSYADVYRVAEREAAAQGFGYAWMAGQWPRTFPPCAGFFR